MKKLIATLVIAAAATSAQAGNVKAPVHTGLGYLAAGFRDNLAGTSAELLGAEVVVSARLVGKVDMGQYHLLQLSDRLQPAATADARLEPSQSAVAATLRPGAAVTVRCGSAVPGWTGITLKDCVIEER